MNSPQIKARQDMRTVLPLRGPAPGARCEQRFGTSLLRLIVVAFALFAPRVEAHIGSPNVFYEGLAGAYPVRVVIRPPGVIPGLAEISVRVQTNGVQRVTVLPVRWDTGRQGAPPPDEALPVVGETNLYSAQLWFMRGGAESVEIDISGNAGTGKVIVPVNAIATRVLEMPRLLGSVLALLGLLLFALFVSIAGSAIRESVLPAGDQPSSRRRWGARFVMLLAVVAAGGFLWFGKRWWDSEAGDYRNNRLYQPLDCKALLETDATSTKLRLEVTDERFRRNAALVPDHGKLMHLFLIREPDLDAFAHLHPRKQDWRTFDTPLPPLPAGQYRVYADVTYETGLTETLATAFALNTAMSTKSASPDPDDAWVVTPPSSAGSNKRLSSLRSSFTLEWLPVEGLVENREMTLQFLVRDSSGAPVPVEPYMGMSGHLILCRDDGTVFTHLHPSGSFSMASQQLFELRADGKAPRKVAPVTGDPICQLPSMADSQSAWLARNPGDGAQTISFPYAFPKAGKYRLWVQVKLRGEVRTGVFDADVQPAF